jgi:hypothetical protein
MWKIQRILRITTLFLTKAKKKATIPILFIEQLEIETFVKEISERARELKEEIQFSSFKIITDQW